MSSRNARVGFGLAFLTALCFSLAACAPAAPAAVETHTSNVPAAADLGDPALLNDGATLGIYEVDGDDLVGDVDPEYAKRWERFVELFPLESRPEVTLFVAMDGAASDADGILHVIPADPDKRWLALDVIGDLTPKFDRTMIHEFGHLLTLRSAQVPNNPGTVDACPVWAQTGCPLEDSYIYQFEATFWPDLAGFDVDDSAAAIADRYATGDFVSAYAATNPQEDIAETFASWMTDDTQADAGSILEEKLTFFDSFPEVVDLKTHVQEVLAG